MDLIRSIIVFIPFIFVVICLPSLVSFAVTPIKFDFISRNKMSLHFLIDIILKPSSHLQPMTVKKTEKWEN